MVNEVFKTINGVIVNMNLKKYVVGMVVASFLLLSAPKYLNDYGSCSKIYKAPEKITGDLNSGIPSKVD